MSNAPTPRKTITENFDKVQFQQGYESKINSIRGNESFKSRKMSRNSIIEN